jgi:prephenate dehydrogenase
MTMKRLSILGVGLLGGSLAMAVRNAVTGCRIVGYGPRPENLKAALDRGILDEIHENPADAVKEADWVVICTPVGTFGELISKISPALKADAIVTDVGSTKRSIVAAAAGLPHPGHFVGSHPMAGSEKRGVEHAAGDLFQGALCIVTPTPATDRAVLTQVEDFWRTIGMRTQRMTPEDHDARVALASHLPHALAAALMRLQTPDSLAVAGRGLSDTTRIAAGDGGLWRDIFIDNKDNLRRGIEQLRGQLDQLLAAFDQNDADAVRKWLNEAAEKREGLVGRQ